MDGAPQFRGGSLKRPARSTAILEVDTTYLRNGPHTLAVQAHDPQPPDAAAGASGCTIHSPPVVINVTNGIRYPAWQDQADLAVKVDLETDLTLAEYTLWFFNSAYAKSQGPFYPAIQTAYYQGTATNGIVSYSEAAAALGFGDGESDPDIYSFTEFTPQGSGSGRATANRNTRQIRPSRHEASGLSLTRCTVATGGGTGPIGSIGRCSIPRTPSAITTSTPFS